MNTQQSITPREVFETAKKWAKKFFESKWFTAIKYVFHFLAVPCIINLCINNFFLNTTTIRDTQFASGYFFSYVLVVLFNALFTCITTSSVAGNVTLSLVGFVFSAVQYVKIQMSDNPVYFSDINFFRSAGTLGDLVAEISVIDLFKQISGELWKFGLVAAMIIIGGILLRFRIKYKWNGIAIGGTALLLLFLIIAPIEPLNTFTLNTFYKYDERDSDYPVR